MGLDMYYFKAKKTDGIHAVATDRSEVLGNLRKCNQVFKWFQDNGIVSGGDQEIAQVTKEDLSKLLYDIAYVCSNKESAETYMPRVSGHFFGNQEYGEQYFDELKYTIVCTAEAILHTNWDSENLYIVTWF